MDPLILSLIVFVAVVAMVAAIAYAFTDVNSTKAEDRLEVFTGKKSALGGGNTSIMKDELIREGMGGISIIFNKFVKKITNTRRFFEQADSPIKVDTFFIISIVCFCLGVLIAWLGRAPRPLYPVCGLCVGLMPLGWLMFRRKKRLGKFALQLPDALELIARALRSGHSLGSGLNLVVQEMDNSFDELSGILSLTGNSVRLKLLFLLSKEGRLCVRDLSDILEMNVSAISQHLRKLKDRNLIYSKKEAQTIFYSITKDKLALLNPFFKILDNSTVIKESV